MKDLLRTISTFALALGLAAPGLTTGWAADLTRQSLSSAYLAAASADDEARGPKLRQDAFNGGTEIRFKGRTALDNGLQVGFHTEISHQDYAAETVQRLVLPGHGGDHIQSVFVYVKSGLGTVAFGDQNGLYDGVAPALASVSHDATSGLSLPIVRPLQLNGASASNAQSGLSKVSYFTPRFGGVQFGVSFNPATTNPAALTLNLPASMIQSGASKSLEFNANYRTQFKGFMVELGGSYLNGRTALASGTNDLVQWGASGALGLSLPRGGDLAFAGSYRKSSCTDFGCSSGLNWLDSGASDAWNFGLRYSLGSWNLGGYFLTGHRVDMPGSSLPSQNSMVFLQTSIDF
jgi:predicted porin